MEVVLLGPAMGMQSVLNRCTKQVGDEQVRNRGLVFPDAKIPMSN